MQSYDEQRSAIQNEVDTYFTESIEITPRAMAALHGTGSEYWADEDQWVIEAVSVFHSLLVSTPATFMALHDAGVDTTKLAKNLGRQRNQSLAPLAPNTLEVIFRGFFDQHNIGLQIHADEQLAPDRTLEENIISSRRLTEVDLFHGFLGTAYMGPLVARESFDAEDYRFCLSEVGELLVSSGFADRLMLKEWLDDSGVYRANVNVADEFSKLIRKSRKIKLFDPSHSLHQLGCYLDSRDRLRFIFFGGAATGVHEANLHDKGLDLGFRANFLQPIESVRTSVTEESIAVLEDLVNANKWPEAEFQRFFEAHPDFLLGRSYQRIHPHLALVSEENHEYIPDFFLEPLETRFCDLLDLKLPYTQLVTRLQNNRRVRFRAFVNEAIAQLKEYRRFFDEKVHRSEFYAKYGLEAYKPRMILVAGRTHHFESDLERKELGQLLPRDFELWTYDDLVLRAKRYLSFARNVG